VAEELWVRLGEKFPISKAKWPTYDASKLVKSDTKIILQINEKVRDEILVDIDVTQEMVEKMPGNRADSLLF
jgi:leucyl-tRNA synthetase